MLMQGRGETFWIIMGLHMSSIYPTPRSSLTPLGWHDEALTAAKLMGDTEHVRTYTFAFRAQAGNETRMHRHTL